MKRPIIELTELEWRKGKMEAAAYLAVISFEMACYQVKSKFLTILQNNSSEPARKNSNDKTSS